MPLLSSCCILLDLKVGTKIVGVIKLIASLLSSIGLAILLGVLVFLDTGVSIASTLHEENRRNNFAEDDDYVDTHDQPKQIFELLKENITYVKIALYILVALSLLSVITCSMLIHGVRRDRRGLLLPFIIQEVVNIITFFALNISVAVIFGVSAVLSIVLSAAVGCLIEIYFLLVVISQYQALGLLRMHEEISMK